MKVLVVGAGLIGTCTAYFLNRLGHDVSVVERGPGPACDTSFANGGMLTPSQSEPWNHPGVFWTLMASLGREDSAFLIRPRVLASTFTWGIRFLVNSGKHRFHDNMARNVRLASYSLQTIRELRAALALQYDGCALGTLKFFTDYQVYLRSRQQSVIYSELGVRYQLLSAEETLELEPSLIRLAGELAGSIYYPDDESGDAFLFCGQLAQHAAAGGVHFEYGIEVDGIAHAGSKVTGLSTSGGDMNADVYVLAAGSYSPLLARTASLDIPVRPVKGYSLTIEKPGGTGGPRLPVIDETRHIAMVPLGDRLRVAGTAELVGYDRSIPASRLDNLTRYVNRVYPGLAPAGKDLVPSAWAGLRPYSCDGVPYIGRSRYPNLFINTGHGHLGWSMCAGSGKLLADLISGKSPAIDPEPYSPGR